MTKKQMITRIVKDQQERGIVPAGREALKLQVSARLNGIGAMKPWSYAETVKAYNGYFGIA